MPPYSRADSPTVLAFFPNSSKTYPGVISVNFLTGLTNCFPDYMSGAIGGILPLDSSLNWIKKTLQEFDNRPLLVFAIFLYKLIPASRSSIKIPLVFYCLPSLDS